MANGATFKAQLGKWKERFPQQMDALARQTCQQISQNVVLATPVDTGFLRSSWQPSIGDRASGKGDVYGTAGSGAEAAAAKVMSEIGLAVAGMKAGDMFHMSNNANYAEHVEFGTTKMAGRFFVTDNVKRWPVVVDEMAKDLGLK